MNNSHLLEPFVRNANLNIVVLVKTQDHKVVISVYQDGNLIKNQTLVLIVMVIQSLKYACSAP